MSAFQVSLMDGTFSPFSFNSKLSSAFWQISTLLLVVIALPVSVCVCVCVCLCLCLCVCERVRTSLMRPLQRNLLLYELSLFLAVSPWTLASSRSPAKWQSLNGWKLYKNGVSKDTSGSRTSEPGWGPNFSRNFWTTFFRAFPKQFLHFPQKISSISQHFWWPSFLVMDFCNVLSWYFSVGGANP